MSKKQAKKKDRSRQMTIDFGKPVTLNAVSFDPATGRAQFFNDGVAVSPERAFVEQSYERGKGPKVLVRADLLAEKAFLDPNRALEHYSEVYAVDTNTKEIEGESVSVCGIVGGVSVSMPGHTAVRYRPLQCMEFRAIAENAEKVAWVEVIEAITRSPKFSRKKSYGLIIDAYLGELAALNERAEPLLEGFYLPREFTLIYASADVANDSLANKMLALADQISTVILRRIERQPPDFPLSEVSDKPYRAQRLWMPKA